MSRGNQPARAQQLALDFSTHADPDPGLVLALASQIDICCCDVAAHAHFLLDDLWHRIGVAMPCLRHDPSAYAQFSITALALDRRELRAAIRAITVMFLADVRACGTAADAPTGKKPSGSERRSHDACATRS